MSLTKGNLSVIQSMASYSPSTAVRYYRFLTSDGYQLIGMQKASPIPAKDEKVCLKCGNLFQKTELNAHVWNNKKFCDRNACRNYEPIRRSPRI